MLSYYRDRIACAWSAPTRPARAPLHALLKAFIVPAQKTNMAALSYSVNSERYCEFFYCCHLYLDVRIYLLICDGYFVVVFLSFFLLPTLALYFLWKLQCRHLSFLSILTGPYRTDKVETYSHFHKSNFIWIVKLTTPSSNEYLF